MEYFQTLIAVAYDCPVGESEVPPNRRAKKTVANLHYELLSENPGTFTQEDVLFQSWLLRQEGIDTFGSEVDQLREQFFDKPQASLRSSPLPKRYGWGLLFDAEGRVTLCPMESEQYRDILAGEVTGVKVLRALRFKRA